MGTNQQTNEGGRAISGLSYVRVRDIDGIYAETYEGSSLVMRERVFFPYDDCIADAPFVDLVNGDES